MKSKKIIAMLLSCALILNITACGGGKKDDDAQPTDNAVTAGSDSGTDSATQGQGSEKSPVSEEEIQEVVSRLSLEEKAAQMVQGAGYKMSDEEMKENGYGSVLHKGDRDSAEEWKTFILDMQKNALESPSKIPFIYGTDAVHGLIKCDETVVFPHNIGIGAANDEELTYKMGLAVADEMKIAGMLWNFAPCVTPATDPRWGRTYESYSTDIEIIKTLGSAYAKGNKDGGVLACVKHFIGEGDAEFGTGEEGEGSRLIDRGEATIDEARLAELTSVYKKIIDDGARSVMISHCAVNGVKMHANKDLITGVLKGELGFDGLVVSDWESIHNIPDTDGLKEQVAASVNAGIDMLMEPDRYEQVAKYIVEGVNEGTIEMSRVDDAVTRIVRVKMEMGLFDDPMQEKLETEQTNVGSDEYRDLARQLVEKSLVLLKNEESVLPLKSGSKIYVTGPAANDTGVLCGGWTYGWLGETDNGDKKFVPEGKTILDGFEALAEEYDLTIITDPEKAGDADLTVLCLGEKPYAEWLGDSKDISITGSSALGKNEDAINEAAALGKPTVTLITAGRNVIYDEYEDNWDAVVMCYLPGSEGDGVANVICGKVPFTGKLPMPYYSKVEDIKTENVKFDVGYGLE